MEKGGYFPFLPLPQAETNLRSLQRVLKKRQQMREKEMQLCHQLDVVCQRQCETHRRNQDLLRDFQRIEHELAHLAAKTDNVRINQENYMKQMQTIIPMHYEYLTPSSCAISKQFCHTVIGNLPADCSNFTKKCHPTDSMDHSGKALWPNRLIGIQGGCSRSAYCWCVYPCSDDGFVPCNRKMSDFPQTSVSQKERRSTNDLLFHREYRFNRKHVRTQQYPEYTNKIIASSIMPPRQWNIDFSEKCPIGAREDDVKNKVKSKVRKPFKENRREILALHQEVPSNSFVSEWKYPSGSVCKLKHLSSALICPKCDDDEVDDDHDDDDDDTETLHKGAGKLSHQQILSKNFDGYKEEELEVETQEYKEKTSCKSNKNGQMAETLQKSHKKKILKSNSKMERNGKEVESQPIVKDLNNQTLPTKFEKVHDVELLGIVIGGLNEEINDFEEISDSKDNELVKGKAKNPTPSLAELLNGQSSLESNQTQNEGRVQSDSSQNDSSSESGGRQSVSYTCFQMKEHQNVSGEAQCELSTPSRGNFIAQNDETGEDKIWEECDSQREEQGDEDVKMLDGKLNSVEIRISKTKEAKKCLMYGGKSEMTSNSEEEDDEESIDGNDPRCEIANIVVANDGEIKDTKSSEKKDDDDNDEKVDDDNDKKDVNEADNDDHDVDDDEFSIISREEGKTGDRIQNNDNLEENCSIENNENEAINEGEDESGQEEEQSSSTDHDEVEDTEGSEDEENLLACDNKDKGLETEGSDYNLSLKNMSEDGDLNMETSIRVEELAQLEEKAPLVMLPEIMFSHSESQQRKRCSEDGSMALLQLNPVESRSSFPEQESSVSPTSRHTEVASVIKAPSEDSSEEFSHNEKESEKSSPGRSDSEDDVHSFYD